MDMSPSQARISLTTLASSFSTAETSREGRYGTCDSGDISTPVSTVASSPYDESIPSSVVKTSSSVAQIGPA